MRNTLWNYLYTVLILFIFLISPVYNLIDILKEGAIPKTDTISCQFQNSRIITNSILKANSSINDRVVRIPHGYTFYSMPLVLKNLYNVTIIIEGKLSASKNIRKWPKKPNSAAYQDFIYITNCQLIQISGSGKIDGRGYHWWMVQWMRLKKLRPLNSARPHLINIQRSSKFKIHDIVLKNSPCFHIKTWGSFYFQIYNLDIKVNTTAQLSLSQKFIHPQTFFEGIVPLFPLNTDGIDPAGKQYHIWNITVQNYDDVVVPKPSHKGQNPICDCTQNILIQNITVRLGVGLSIGSVPPNSQRNCIRNVTFKNAIFQKPFKAIYLKTNPGNTGSGQIKNIVYQNMKIIQPIWWAIYLGPQQQKQPLGGGPGCMLYPFDPRGTCATQPLIDIDNITFKQIQVHDSLLFPIVFRCNQTNPCTNINLKNVKIDRWLIGKKNDGYVCQNVYGHQEGGKPKLSCLQQQYQYQMQQNDNNLNLRQQNINNNNNNKPRHKFYYQLQKNMNLIQSILQNNVQNIFIKFIQKQKLMQVFNMLWQYLKQQTKQIRYIEQDDEMDEQQEQFWDNKFQQYIGNSQNQKINNDLLIV